jgi:hypothetical protein
VQLISFCLDAKRNKKIKAAGKELKFISFRYMENAKAPH